MDPIAKKCTTGVHGLDDILVGGYPRNCLYLIEGRPGAGKTTLAMQFLLDGKRLGETCLYVTLSETKRELEAVAVSHAWDLNGIAIIELSAVERATNADLRSNTIFQSADVELTQLTTLIMEEVRRIRPSRVVLDSLSEMRLLAQNPSRYRRAILGLKQKITAEHCTVLLLDDQSQEGSDVQVHSIVHGAITLRMAPLGFGICRRSIAVTKMRGVQYREGNHDFIIKAGGVQVFARLIAADFHTAFTRATASSGNKELDMLLGDGLHYGTSNLFIGPAGSGKSTLAAMFAHAAATRGEQVKYYVFDESRATLCSRASDMHIDLQPHLDSGRLSIDQMDPAAISPGELAFRVRTSVEQENTKVVVLDSLNGYINAMPDEEFLHLHLHELLSYLNQQGVMTVMVLAQHGLMGPMGSPVDVSYLADSVIITRFFEAMGSIRKAISIIKKRSGPHESTVRELTMSASGVAVGAPLTQFQGVLTGVPKYLGGGAH
jgi:circadian clock protein KaiC